jgi:hypothetical protein
LEESLEKTAQPTSSRPPRKTLRRKPETLQPTPKPTAPILSAYDYRYHYPPPQPHQPQVEESPATESAEWTSQQTSEEAPKQEMEAAAPSPQTTAFVDSAKKAKVRKGMSESEVESLLGAPRNTQTFYLADDTYHVWFYSRNTRTPFTFKNGVLVGTTTDYYEGIKQAADHDRIEGYDKKGERMQQDEMEQDFDYW